MDLIKIILTSFFSVIVLFVITKIMGHKQVAQLDFFDYISGITIGSIGAEMATDLENPWQSLVALLVYGAVSLFLTFLSQKNLRVRKYVNGSPTILMHTGKLYRENFKKAKLDLSEFLLQCRQRGFFDLSEIQTAVFEHNGTLSILPKAIFRPATPGDLSLSVPQSHIGVEVIMDGRILEENLSRMGKNKTWLQKQMAKQGYRKAEEIFLGVYYNESDSLSLYQSKVKVK